MRNAGGVALSGVAVLMGLVGMVALCITGTLFVESEPAVAAPAGEDGLKGLAASFDEAAGRRAYEHVEALAGMGVKTIGEVANEEEAPAYIIQQLLQVGESPSLTSVFRGQLLPFNP